MEFDLLTYARRHRYVIAASALILCGVVVRLALTLIGWPHSDSEEGTMGLEAMHILLRGERPVYLYGQNYMGVGEAYVASFSFRIFGISVVSLRLGMLLFYAIFMVGVFWLANQLYSHRVALASAAVLILGTPFLVQMELLADGGKVETIACGAIMFALATWLALTRSRAGVSVKQRLLRAAALGGWGLVAGFGLYTYPVVAPLVLTSGVLIAVTCWSELRGFALLVLIAPVAGFLVGYLPAILYSIAQPAQGNPIAVFLFLHHSLNNSGSGLHLVFKQFEATLLYTLPSVTGMPQFYLKNSLPLYGPPTVLTLVAVVVGGGWSAGYLILLGLATYRPARAVWAQRATFNSNVQAGQAPISSEQTDATVSMAAPAKNLARLLLALTAWLIIASYIISPTAANNPYSGRYMIGLLVTLPTVLWALLDWAPRVSNASIKGRVRRVEVFVRRQWRRLALILAIAGLIIGAVATVHDVPAVVALNHHDAQFTDDLLSRGITRFYSDYWTCDLLNFDTQERLICSVVQDYGNPGPTRYTPYTQEVQADAAAPYVLVSGSEIDRTFVQHAAEAHLSFSLEYLDGYSVYTPTSP